MTLSLEAQHLPSEGWFACAQQLKSPNFGARPLGTSVDLIVVHSISLPPGQFVGDNVQALFTDQLDWDAHPYFRTIKGLRVSSHFYIRRDGQLWQFVSCNDRAWHAGASSFLGRENCNDFSIGIELEGLEGDPFEAAQYEALAQVCRWIKSHYPIAHVVGHEHIAPGRKFDPGAQFDWALLADTLTWPLQCFPVLSSSQRAM